MLSELSDFLKMNIQFHGGDTASGNVFAVETKAPAGYLLESHKHEHGHLSVLVKGTADVTIAGVVERMEGYRMVSIPPGVPHCVQAVTDVIWLCLWAEDVAPKGLAEESLKLVPNHD